MDSGFGLDRGSEWSSEVSNLYERIKVIGQGAHGTAWLVRRKSDDRRLVVKEVSWDGLSDEERKVARREAMLVKSLHHPNIVQYEGHHEDDDRLLLVTEYCEGGDLENWLEARDGKLLPESQALNYFAQICLAMEHLHSKKVLHRDLKTANIFLTNHGVLKLGDFGIAKILPTTKAHAVTMCGTPFYFSPELCDGKPYNAKSDMWALGVLLYQLLSLAKPFEGSNILALINQISYANPRPLPAEYSPEAKAIVSQLLQKDATLRPDINALIKKPALSRALRDLRTKMERELQGVEKEDKAKEEAVRPPSIERPPRLPLGDAPPNEISNRREQVKKSPKEYEDEARSQWLENRRAAAENKRKCRGEVGPSPTPSPVLPKGRSPSPAPSQASSAAAEPSSHAAYLREVRREAERNRLRLQQALQEEESTDDDQLLAPPGNRQKVVFDTPAPPPVRTEEPCLLPEPDQQPTCPPNGSFNTSLAVVAGPDLRSVTEAVCSQCPDFEHTPATVHCMECSDYYCAACSAKLHSLRSFRFHHLALLQASPATTIERRSEPPRSDQHSSLDQPTILNPPEPSSFARRPSKDDEPLPLPKDDTRSEGKSSSSRRPVRSSWDEEAKQRRGSSASVDLLPPPRGAASHVRSSSPEFFACDKGTSPRSQSSEDHKLRPPVQTVQAPDPTPPPQPLATPAPTAPPSHPLAIETRRPPSDSEKTPPSSRSSSTAALRPLPTKTQADKQPEGQCCTIQ